MWVYNDAICLIKFTREKGSHVVKMIPENFNLGPEQQYFISCALPESETEKDHIYTVVVASHFCFIWSFQYENDFYSIGIISHHYLADIFLKFLKVSQADLKKNDPLDRLNKINETLQQWKVDECNNLEIHFTQGKFLTVRIDSSYITFKQFNPASYFSYTTDWVQIWHNLMGNKGILLFGTSADIVSQAALSLISFFSPLKYCEPLLSYTRLGDPRFAEIINGSKKWKIVGTTNQLAYERCNQFGLKLVVEFQTTPKDVSRELHEVNKLHNRLLRRIEVELDELLDKDPFADLLDIEISSEKIQDFIPHTNKERQLTVEEAYAFSRTETFHQWRQGIVFRDVFRDAFLSFEPEAALKNRTPEMYPQIKEGLLILTKNYPNDVHINAVVKRYQKLLRQIAKTDKE